MHKVKKALFPVAGYGTRFLPATKAYPKEMLPIIDKPLIQYAVEEAIQAGCTELIFITNHAKKAIEDHFDRNIALDQHLLQKQEYAALDLINKIIPKNITCVYLRQPQPRGLGHAISCARSLINDEPFAVILADDLIRTNGKNCLSQMIDIHSQAKCSVVAIEKVETEQVSNYGIVSFHKQEANGGFIKSLVEKPDINFAPSNLAVVGRYILNPSIFKAINLIENELNHGEIQLTDALSKQLEWEDIFALEFDGNRYDCGKKSDYIRAILEFAFADPLYTSFLTNVISGLTRENLKSL